MAGFEKVDSKSRVVKKTTLRCVAAVPPFWRRPSETQHWSMLIRLKAQPNGPSTTNAGTVRKPEAWKRQRDSAPLAGRGAFYHPVLYFYNSTLPVSKRKGQRGIVQGHSSASCVSPICDVRYLRYSIPRMTSLKYNLARSSDKGWSVGTSITGLHSRGAHVTFEFNRKDAWADVNSLIQQHSTQV